MVLFQHKVNKYFNYYFMIDNTSICNIYLLKFIVFDGVSKMYVLLHPKRGIREKELEKLDVRNMLVLNMLVHP